LQATGMIAPGYGFVTISDRSGLQTFSAA